MAKRKTAAKKKEEFVIKVGWRYWADEEGIALVEDISEAMSFETRKEALNFAALIYDSRHEHKYKVVPK